MFGLIVLVASWRIDRLESLHINPWSIPGLLPGIVGVLIMLLAIALAWQARCGTAPAASAASAALPAAAAGATAAATVPASAPAASEPEGSRMEEWGRILAAAALCVLFAGVSLGRGLPFMAEAAAFIFLFIAAFSWPQWRAENRQLRGLATTFVTAVVAAACISWLFESVFLVRLP